jgi:hypothetical protein
MTNEQYKLQNSDLRARLANGRVARQISEDALHARIKELEQMVRDRDKQVRMLQSAIASGEAAYRRVMDERDALQKEHGKLSQTCGALADKVAALTARINKDSSNSSKPPSSDGLKHVIRNNRTKSGRKPGGQPGHKGHGLAMTEKLKELMDSGAVPVEVVEHGNPTASYVSKYELDIRATAVIKEHRFYQGETIPDSLIKPLSYGPNLKAICIYLSTVGLVAAERVSGFISEISGGIVHPSKASVLAFQEDLSALLDNEIAAIRESLLNAPVLHVDETPIKSTQRPAEDGNTIEEAKGTTFTVCARTHSTDDATLITVNPRKDIKGILSDNILPLVTHPMVHDHDLKYYNFGTDKQGECDIHIGRYLLEVFDLTKHKWAEDMGALLLKMLAHKNKDVANNRKSMDPDSLRQYSEEYDRIISLAKAENETLPLKNTIWTTERNLFSRLEKYKDNHLLFAYDYTVPFSNNAAERDFRWIKTRQKVSGCHRSYDGAVVMMRLMSFILTLKKRKIPIFEALNDIIGHQPVLAFSEAMGAVA